MQPDRRRRQLVLLMPVAALLPACMLREESTATDDLVRSKFLDLERESGGRLGVCAVDVASGRSIGHRVDERFGMCSTFKLALAGIVLREIDAGRLQHDEILPYTTDDLVAHAPVTTRYLKAGGMPVRELAKAAQMTSDNVASNLLVRRLGGPERFTQILRELGDSKTRLDRYEPELNLVMPGDDRDTTTPAAMARTASLFFDDGVLRPSSRALLAQWLVETQTGPRRLRAGLPGDWRVGNKTGTGLAAAMANKTNDIAVAWPSPAKRFTVAAYFETDRAYPEFRAEDEAVLAEVGRIVSAWHAAVV